MVQTQAKHALHRKFLKGNLIAHFYFGKISTARNCLVQVIEFPRSNISLYYGRFFRVKIFKKIYIHICFIQEEFQISDLVW